MKVHKLIHWQLPMVWNNLFQILPTFCKTLHLHWLNTYSPTKFSCWQWYSSITTHNCHHQITYCKFNLIIEYPPPYQRLVWDYKRANVNSIKQALYQVNWSTILLNKDLHQQINILNSMILNIFTNYVSNKVITIDDKDPPWKTDFIKSKTEWRNSIYKTSQNSSKNLAE